jgi:hypothetical protein
MQGIADKKARIDDDVHLPAFQKPSGKSTEEILEIHGNRGKC